MSIPLSLWNAYRYRTKSQMKWIWIAVVALALVLLARTYSRSSILSVGVIGIFFCLSFKLNRTGFLLVLIAGTLFVAATASTALLDMTYKQYVLKGNIAENGIIYSRRDVWQQSYDNAQQGGWFGAGYGVSIGETNFAGDLTAVGYGREK